MSSPNLNVLTLFGSVLTYSSGFLFALDEQTHSQGGASTAALQVSPTVSSNPPLDFWIDHCWIIMLSPTGSDVDSLCRQYPGVWPDFGEDVETVQGVHPASAWQESGRQAVWLFVFPALTTLLCVCVNPVTPGCNDDIPNGFSELTSVWCTVNMWQQMMPETFSGQENKSRFYCWFS